MNGYLVRLICRTKEVRGLLSTKSPEERREAIDGGDCGVALRHSDREIETKKYASFRAGTFAKSADKGLRLSDWLWCLGSEQSRPDESHGHPLLVGESAPITVSNEYRIGKRSRGHDANEPAWAGTFVRAGTGSCL